MAHRRSFGSARAHKRQTEWVLGNFGSATSSATGSVLYPTGFQPVVSGLTIVRIRGELILSSLMNAATDSFQAAAGFIMVSDEAFAAGAASIPSPQSDADDDWIWHQWCSVQSGVLGAPGQGTEFRFDIDNKAMRKFPGGKTLVGVLETFNEVGTVVIDTIINTRILVKLP